MRFGSEKSSMKMPISSKIFSGFRALGFVSNDVPLAVRYNQKHKENYVVTCVGKAFHTYNCSKLGIVSVSDSHDEPIACLAVDARLVFTAAENNVYAFARGKQVVHTYQGHNLPVHLLLPFSRHLISVDRESLVKIWDIESEEIYLELQFDNETFEITSLLSPSTYVNKVLLGSRQGTLQLWNIRTSKQLYVFAGWQSPVTVLEQAPAVDVAAVGLADGQVFLHNLKFDETLMNFSQDWGPVTSIAFRTDGHPIMATGSTLGHIALWNLEEKKLQSQMREAHCGAVTGMKCLPSEPLMITSSPDNSLRVWIFDQPDGGGRLLRHRSGHSEPPNRIHFHDQNGQTILSAGQDSTLMSFSTVHDRHNRSLGRASFNKAESKKSGLKRDQHRMPPIVEFASETSRQSDWDGIAAVHRGLKEVTTWNYNRFTMGQHRLQHDRFKDKKYIHTSALVVTITSCGNFVLVGYSSGHVDMFNIQSGIHRGSYGSPTAHEGAVRGLAVDSLNQATVTGGADCRLKFWKFKTKQLLEILEVGSQVSKMVLHRENSMLAVSLDDFGVLVIDIDMRRIVRRFLNHLNTITDMAFSPDGRWLVTSSMDSCVRTWDLPSGCLVDCFLVGNPVTSLSLSPTADFLATTHVDDLGLYLWSNMTLYTHVALRPLAADYQPSMMDLPSTSHLSAGLREESEEDEYAMTAFKSPDQISEELVTLANLPHSRWQNLLNLDVIKQRNKPKKPPKAPKSAPFFLPTIAGLEPKFASPEEIGKDMAASRILTQQLQPVTEFGKLLCTADDKQFDAVLEMLKSMGASAVDLEMRSLAPEGGGSIQLMLAFMFFINHVLLTNKDFELAQAWLALFIKLHGDIIASEPELVEATRTIQHSQVKAWTKLQEMFNQTLCLVNYLKSATF